MMQPLYQRKIAKLPSTKIFNLISYSIKSNWCPVIARNSIISGATSVPDIWQTIRLYYNIQNAGSKFLDLAGIEFGADECPEDLYQHLVAFL